MALVLNPLVAIGVPCVSMDFDRFPKGCHSIGYERMENMWGSTNYHSNRNLKRHMWLPTPIPQVKKYEN